MDVRRGDPGEGSSVWPEDGVVRPVCQTKVNSSADVEIKCCSGEHGFYVMFWAAQTCGV